MSLSDRFFAGSGGELAKPSVASLFPSAQVLTVIAVAVIFRALYWSLASGSNFMHTPVVDGSFFDIWARTLAEGRVFQAQPFFKPPLYAYLLSFLYKMGLGMTGVFVLQMVVGTINCALALAIGRIAFSPHQAFAGAIITALLPILPFFETQLLAESWTLALTLGALLPVLLMVSGKAKPSAKYLALAGALLGLAALGRPNLMLLVVVLAGCLWWWGRSGGRLGPVAVAPLLIGFVIAISPATLHNIQHGEFALISANMGVNLYTGQSDFADGVSAIPVGVLWDDIQLRSQQAGARGPVASSRYLTSETLKWMGSHPGQTLGLWLKKAVLVCSGIEGRNNINPMWLAQQDGVFVLSRWWPATWLMLPFAIIGLVWAGRGSAPVWLLKWVVLSQAAAIIPFFVTARFRAPLLPMLALLAAAGFVILIQAVGKRQWLVLGAFAVALAVVNVDWYGLGHERWLARDYFNQALIQSRAYDDRLPNPLQAEKYYRQALALDNTDVDINERFGATLLGRAQPLVSQGKALVQQNNSRAAEVSFASAEVLLREAEGLHLKATEIFPRSFRSWGNLGTCQMWQADIRALRAQVRLQAGDKKGATSLALDALGRYQVAVSSLQSAVRVNQAQPDVHRQIQMIWPAVLALPAIDPAIVRIQEQLKTRMEGSR